MRQPDVVLDGGNIRLYCGDCLEILPTLEAGSVDAVVTSPPYAEQRKGLYAGVAEVRYPLWTANWVLAAENAIKTSGSWLINIREHIRNGEISDYVHKTRMLLRDVGLVEAEEIIWVKPDSPPVGSLKRPRRAWERVLWFAKNGDPYCNTTAHGNESERIGIDSTISSDSWVRGASESYRSGRSRHRDYCEIGTGQNDSGVEHPAKYPTKFAEWMILGFCPEDGTILDPFMGSGTTGVACVKTGRKFIGIELDRGYFDIAVKRIGKAIAERDAAQKELVTQ